MDILLASTKLNERLIGSHAYKAEQDVPYLKVVMNKQIKIRLTRYQRDLLLKYGYPFDEMEAQLLAASEKKEAIIGDESYWWEQVLGNLSFSARKKNLSDSLIEDIDELMTLIDFEMK
jgi:hypothetical protein